ncbi:MAG: glucosamine-6-phosphate deaminase [Bdellovibrionia bacterium]
MEVVILKNSHEVAKRGADLCCELLKKKPNAVLGLATGSTPVALYAELIERHKRGEVSFKKATTFNLDEYVGLAPAHAQSYRHFMNTVFFDHIDINKKKTFIPDGAAKNPRLVGAKYEKKIKEAGGIDLQILGIGRNGHIGFNEPTSSLSSRTRIKTLTETTFSDNGRFFDPGEEQPGLGITMGIGTILEAKKIILLATGQQKAEAIGNAVEGPLTSLCPASSLQLHRSATVLADEAACEKLKLKPYYYWVMKRQAEILQKYPE